MIFLICIFLVTVIMPTKAFARSPSTLEVVMMRGQWVHLSFNGDESVTRQFNGLYQFDGQPKDSLDGHPLNFRTRQGEHCQFHWMFKSFDCRTVHGTKWIDFIHKNNYTMVLLGYVYYGMSQSDVAPSPYAHLLRARDEYNYVRMGLSKSTYQMRTSNIREMLKSVAMRLIDACDDKCMWDINKSFASCPNEQQWVKIDWIVSGDKSAGRIDWWEHLL